MYDLDEWNVYTRFEEDLVRTTNCQEDFHHHINIVANHNHLETRELISLLMEEDVRTGHRAQQHIIAQGKPPTKSGEQRKLCRRRVQNCRFILTFPL